MTQISKRPLDKKIESELFQLLVKAIADLRNSEEIEEFLADFLSPVEKIMLAKRLGIAVLMGKNYDYRQVKEVLKVTPGTIAAVNLKYKYANRGYKKVVEKILKQEKTGELFNRIGDFLTSVPPKGGDWSVWRRRKEQAKVARQKIL
ncbi:MAG: Trp family transcriptional regulator [Candidatus Shapirobacteria bacterium]